MDIQKHTFSSSFGSGCVLAVEIEENSITVRKGQVKLSGQTYEMDDDETFAFTPNPSHEVTLLGYVVEDPDEATKAHVYVDEIVNDGVDAQVRPRDAGFKCLHSLFLLKIPAAASLNGASLVQVFETKEKPERKPS